MTDTTSPQVHEDPIPGFPDRMSVQAPGLSEKLDVIASDAHAFEDHWRGLHREDGPNLFGVKMAMEHAFRAGRVALREEQATQRVDLQALFDSDPVFHERVHLYIQEQLAQRPEMPAVDTYPTILTCSGNYFDFFHPEDCVFTIEDITHHLSNLCRFTGATKWFYSVAQHSVIVSKLVTEPRLRRQALLHDAAEAFIGDVSRPLKQRLPDYKAIEERVERAVLARFGEPYPLASEVRAADLMALAWEKRDLMPARESVRTGTWNVVQGLVPPEERIIPWQPAAARDRFLARFYELS